jgi:hypothetical protein
VAGIAPHTERGSTTQPGIGALYTYDVLWAIDIEFIAEAASGMVDMGDDQEEDQEKRGAVEEAKNLVKAIRSSHFGQSQPAHNGTSKIGYLMAVQAVAVGGCRRGTA